MRFASISTGSGEPNRLSTTDSAGKPVSLHLAVLIEPADDGSFSVWVPDLPGCVSTGDTREEAMSNIAEAIRGHIETLRDLGEPVPAARSLTATVKAT